MMAQKYRTVAICITSKHLSAHFYCEIHAKTEAQDQLLHYSSKRAQGVFSQFAGQKIEHHRSVKIDTSSLYENET